MADTKPALKATHKVGISAGAIVAAMAFIQPWEGLATTAEVDTIGTGHPITYCYGMTSEAGPVQVGQKFTPKQCSDLLAKTLPKYWDDIEPCVHVPLPDKPKAALISAAYNAGPGAVCRSPMLAKMNAGDIKGGCEAFSGWYVRASGRVIQGLVNRRNGERKLCLDGAADPIAKPAPAPKPTILQRIVAFFKRIFHVG
jgi:lysozyme